MKRIRRIVIALAVLPALTVASPAGAQGSGDGSGVDLRPMWRDGQRSRYRITQMEATHQEVAQLDRSMDSTMEFTAELTWEVTDAADGGGGTAELTLDSIEMLITGPDGEQRRVTASQAPEGMESMQGWIEAMTGTPLAYEVAADGSIEGVSGYGPIQNAAGEQSGRLNETYFRELAVDLVALTGGAPGVSPGDGWSHQRSGTHQMGELDYDTAYTLQGVETIEGIDVAMVRFESELDLRPDLSGVPDEASLNVDPREVSERGQIMFDLSRNEIVGAHVERVIDVEITASAGGRSFTQTRRTATNTQILRISEE